MRLFAGLAVVAGLLVPTTAGATSRPAHFVSGHGLHVRVVQQLDARSYDVSVMSADIGRPVHVRILLPARYAQQPHRRFPVLYLFHGTSGRASDWDQQGDAERTTAPYDVITVMPDCGLDGDGGFWFTDWVDRTTSHGPSQFESFLIDQLLPWTDANLRTIAARRGRAVAGLSQGGYGSAAMAARHPDLFAVMASFSGAVEIDRDPEVTAGTTAAIEGIVTGLDHVPPGVVFGSRATDEINWQGHDPATLITNLRGMGIYLWTGAGVPGDKDSSPNPGAIGIEAGVHYLTQRFHQHLVDLGIPSFYDDYTYGTHSWGYWTRDLQAFMKPMMATFAHPSTPRTISYMSIDKTWTQWGWSVSMVRQDRQSFSSLVDATRRGFTLYGDGTALVTTSTMYRSHQRLRVTITNQDGRFSRATTADVHGRLHLVVPLPPSGDAAGTGLARVQVRAVSPATAAA